MDIATRLLQWKDFPPEKWAKMTNRYLPKVAYLLLTLFLAYQLAQLTWVVLTIEDPNISEPLVKLPSISTSPSTQTQNTVDMDQIIERHLFGITTEEFEASTQGRLSTTTESFLDVPDTSLSLQLKGELVTDDFAVSNVAKNINIKVIPVMTDGIKNIVTWRYYCPGCEFDNYLISGTNKTRSRITECPRCGSKLKRKPIKS